MKKLIALLFVSVLLFSCASNYHLSNNSSTYTYSFTRLGVKYKVTRSYSVTVDTLFIKK